MTAGADHRSWKPLRSRCSSLRRVPINAKSRRSSPSPPSASGTGARLDFTVESSKLWCNSLYEAFLLLTTAILGARASKCSEQQRNLLVRSDRAELFLGDQESPSRLPGRIDSCNSADLFSPDSSASGGRSCPAIQAQGRIDRGVQQGFCAPKTVT